MNNKKTEKRVAKGFTSATPNVYDSVRASCPQQATATATRKSGFGFWKMASVALALVLMVLAITGGVSGLVNSASAATVTLDVNPSVEIKLNKKQHVISVTPLNADGEVIVGTMDFAGSSLDVTVNALIGSMLRNGYLSDLANSVLVSVDTNKSTYDALVAKITEEIALAFKGETIQPSVVTQWIKKSDSVSAMVKQYGISYGKAQLINKIVSVPNTTYTVEQLVTLSVNELSLILGNVSGEVDGLVQNGATSDKAYIGKEAAKQIALEQRFTTAEATNIKCSLDFENGTMVYEVEFDSDIWEYDYHIAATTGQVVAWEMEIDDDKFIPPTGALIEESIIKEHILTATFGTADVEVSDYACQFDNKDYQYEISFRTATHLYQFELDRTGRIDSGKMTPIAQADTTAEQAKQVALTHAGLTIDQVRELECELDEHRGMAVYEIEFTANGYEYEYTVNAKTGAILKFDKERD